MSDGVHLLIPFAAFAAAGGGEAAAPALPHLDRLLARLSPDGSDEGSEDSLSPPHERVLAREHGLPAEDGRIPWGAWHAQGAGLATGDAAWACITPCHWRVAADHVAMGHPAELALGEAESRALLDAMRPYFEEDELQLDYLTPDRWLARGEVFRDLPTASFDRVVGRLIEPWLPQGPRAAPLRRLQQEMQMLLYTHPVTDERAARGLPAVNSFWVSGAGALAPPTRAKPETQLQVAQGLRDSALAGDRAAWAAAWQQVDASECAGLLQALDRGTPVRLTLAGERHARSFASTGAGFWKRIGNAFARPRAAATLETL